MTLTKNDIITRIHELGFSKKEAQDLMDELLEAIKGTLEEGEDVLISGFGKFCIKEKDERRGRNPVTGEDLVLPRRRVVTFRCSKRLRDKINDG